MSFNHRRTGVVQSRDEANRETGAKLADDRRVPKGIWHNVLRQSGELADHRPWTRELVRDSPRPTGIADPFGRVAVLGRGLLVTPALEKRFVWPTAGNCGTQCRDHVRADLHCNMGHLLLAAPLAAYGQHEARLL